MTGPRTDCERARGIAGKKEEGQEPSSDETDFARVHLETCEECRLESEVGGALRYEEGATHAEPLDDLARRRLIDEVVRRAVSSHEMRSGARDEERTGAARPSRRRLALAGFAAAAAVVVGVMGWGSLMREPVRTETVARPAAAPGPTSLERAAVLLASGQIRSDTAPLAVADRLDRGAVVHVETGEAVLGIPTGIAALLSTGTRLEIAKLDSEGIVLVLEQGTCVVSATPGRPRPRLEVSTAEGRVLVTGTIFSVTRTDAGSSVSVLRGSVRIEEPGRRPWALSSSHVTELGSGIAKALPAGEAERLWESASAMDILSLEEGTSVSVDSVPASADVRIDGNFMGRTPLAAAVRPGYRRLDVGLAGFTPVSERVEMRTGENVARSFALSPEGSAGQVAAVRPEDAAKPGRSAVSPLAASAQDLLREAQALRAVRDWQGAAAAYRRVMAEHPTSRAARTARVSLGVIELDHLGDATAALTSFDAYLAGGGEGALTAEAAFGRARALRALGRESAERQALGEFVRRCPGAVQCAAATERLAELESSSKIRR